MARLTSTQSLYFTVMEDSDIERWIMARGEWVKILSPHWPLNSQYVFDYSLSVQQATTNFQKLTQQMSVYGTLLAGDTGIKITLKDVNGTI